MIEISCSVVLYNNPVEEVKVAVNSFLKCTLDVKLYLVDNSADDRFRFIFNDQRIEYIYNGRNLGFGAAHNVAIRKAIGKSKYHLVLNPDVEFEAKVLERLAAFMDAHPDTGLLMPKLLYNNGEIQYLCKILPTPAHLFMRRFIPGTLKFLFRRMLDDYELKSKDYNSIMEIPNLSGCFMFIRTQVFEEVGLFDERYFLYLEDTDLSRRINEKFRTVYYPRVSVIHGYKKASYKSFHILRHHLVSSVMYFNKWGWFNDYKREQINHWVIQDTLVSRVLHTGNLVSRYGSQAAAHPALRSRRTLKPITGNTAELESSVSI